MIITDCMGKFWGFVDSQGIVWRWNGHYTADGEPCNFSWFGPWC